MTMWKWFDAQKHNPKHALPAMGTLSIYLLIADMVAAGVVDLPTIQDSGFIINIMDAGGIKGLKSMGYLPNSFKPHTQSAQIVSAAFEEYYKNVESLLTIEERENMPWNTIVAEHTLCKLTRFQKAHHYK